MVPWWRSFSFKFVAVYTAISLVLVLSGVFSVYEREKQEVLGKFGLVLEAIAGTASLSIAGEDVDRIRTRGDASGEAFTRIRAVLAGVQRENHLAEDGIYVLRVVPDHPDTFEFVVMLQAKTFIGDRYRPPATLVPIYDWAVGQKDTVRTPLYRDDAGSFISGIAPILRRDGSVAGLLQVDFGIAVFLEEVLLNRHFLMLGTLLLVVAFGAAGVVMHRALGRDVAALLGGTHAIQREQYDHVVVLESAGELSRIADALNQALRKLKERFEMLKFLPRHTARMIEAAAKTGGVQLAQARLVRATVFESDIRGFTNLSQQLPPEAIVKMLNEYIRVQAEIVEAAGGSIDKFMGDAVLAVFEGEAMERRALESALAIQDAIARMNAAGVFTSPVQVGIGITVGELVMGNMGSHNRMEHTVIGSTVNLAARLCSAAGPGEIVIAEALRGGLGEGRGFELGASEEVKVKGFEAPVRCYRVYGRPL